MTEHAETASVNNNFLSQVLVGVGGSEASFVALQYAMDLATAAGAELTILRVIEPVLTSTLAYLHGDVLAQVIPELERQANAMGERIDERIECELRGRDIKYQIIREVGRVTACVIEAAKYASVIVLGRIGHREDHGGLLGTHTERIVRRSGKPTLVTPSAHTRFRKVILAYGAKDEGSDLPEVAGRYAATLDLPIDIVTVAESFERAEQVWGGLRERMEGLCRAPVFRQEEGPVVSAILRHTDDDRLLVMGACRHSRIYQLVLGNITAEVMREADGSVLLVRPAPDR